MKTNEPFCERVEVIYRKIKLLFSSWKETQITTIIQNKPSHKEQITIRKVKTKMVRVNLHEKRGRQFKVTKKLFTIKLLHRIYSFTPLVIQSRKNIFV